MPGSRFPGLPAHLLGNGDGHRCVPFRPNDGVAEGPSLRSCAVRPRRQRRSSSPPAPGARTLTPAPRWRAGRPRALRVEENRPGGRKNRVPCRDALDIRGSVTDAGRAARRTVPRGGTRPKNRPSGRCCRHLSAVGSWRASPPGAGVLAGGSLVVFAPPESGRRGVMVSSVVGSRSRTVRPGNLMAQRVILRRYTRYLRTTRDREVTLDVDGLYLSTAVSHGSGG